MAGSNSPPSESAGWKRSWFAPPEEQRRNEVLRDSIREVLALVDVDVHVERLDVVVHAATLLPVVLDLRAAVGDPGLLGVRLRLRENRAELAGTLGDDLELVDRAVVRGLRRADAGAVRVALHHHPGADAGVALLAGMTLDAGVRRLNVGCELGAEALGAGAGGNGQCDGGEGGGGADLAEHGVVLSLWV